jgi:predicted DNA-binding transcriptional regulator YafY
VAIARQLAGWADAIEVVEPETVRDELRRIGEALLRRNVTEPAPG